MTARTRLPATYGDMVFVPNGESRMDTAVLLCGTMSEFGLSHRSVKAVRGGFYISPELAGILDTEKTSKPSRATKTSGNRAAKKNSKEE